MFVTVKSHFDCDDETRSHHLFDTKEKALEFIPEIERAIVAKHGYCYSDIDSYWLLEIDEYVDHR